MRAPWFVAVVLAGCGGPRQGECVDDADCKTLPGTVCRAPDYTGACATGTTIPVNYCDLPQGEACTYQEEGQDHPGVCWYVTGACAIEQRCKAPCAADGDCTADGDRCREDQTCTPASCEDGEITCAAGATCTPGDPGADKNGCAHTACAEDKDCGDELFCVLGRCFDTYGICSSSAI